ncbi:MAG: DUF4962 domain-containing protein [Gemmatimonadetes bacterium]|nr:DUF4962 domain-containing protein [Gemmatimonadota bacterium]MBT5144699.1 DUF4962 domain-containing protein [Gemmatimonadota bacterium]MBT5587339.1 DUF4962 domain-containing protein [Gemmatimonadota bacterium]MBT5963310.1 DUF4962 domain-containing protein [Gemmatimonadota bacterium]MBT7456080.1 DUF4962 domain-containing protein [Gemmatimonadota bacterium]
MKEHRSPNPLVDVRRPRDGAVADFNPTGFVWRPIEGAASYELRIGPDAELSSAQTQVYAVTGRCLWVCPDQRQAGIHYWAWRALGAGQDERWSETFQFHVGEGTVNQVIPDGREVVARIGTQRPRHLLPASRLESFRAACHSGDLREEWAGLRRQADERLATNFLMKEPAFLPDRQRDTTAWGKIWKDAMNDSRQFGQDAQLFGLVHLIDGPQRAPGFGEAAVERLLEFASWDVEGATSTVHNNEPHMSVINLGPRAYDWAYDVMSESERAVVREALRGRGNSTMERFRRADYGVTGSDNHSGRLTGFLGECGIVLAGECEDVADWFDFILPTCTAMFPWWGGREGGWAQGVSYSSAYCYLFYHFLFGLREAADVDFYQKDFFRNHGEWRLLCVPPNAYMVPFGDGRTSGSGSVRASYGIQRHLGRIYGDGRYLHHAEQILAANDGTIIESQGLYSPLSFLTPNAPTPDAELPKTAARVFTDIGWLAMRANLVEPEKDIRFMMRCSPYGSVSHSHADQNSFSIEAFGEPLAVPSGLYNLYGSAHHHGWTRQTKAHCAVTFDGAGQIVRSDEATGEFVAFHADDRIGFATGDASPAYDGRVRSYRRSVLFLDYRWFVVIDRMVPEYEAMWTWHMHAVRPIKVDPKTRTATLTYEQAALQVSFCHMQELRLQTHEGWDLMPYGFAEEDEIPEEAARYHLDVGSEMPRQQDTFVTVLCPHRVEEEAPRVVTLDLDGHRGARLETTAGAYLILVDADGTGIDAEGVSAEAELVVQLPAMNGEGPRTYHVGATDPQLSDVTWIDAGSTTCE